jgi:hypothetical protein
MEGIYRESFLEKVLEKHSHHNPNHNHSAREEAN